MPFLTLSTLYVLYTEVFTHRLLALVLPQGEQPVRPLLLGQFFRFPDLGDLPGNLSHRGTWFFHSVRDIDPYCSVVTICWNEEPAFGLIADPFPERAADKVSSSNLLQPRILTTRSMPTWYITELLGTFPGARGGKVGFEVFPRHSRRVCDISGSLTRTSINPSTGLYMTEVDPKTFMPISKNTSEYVLLSSRPSTLPIGANWGGENGSEGVGRKWPGRSRFTATDPVSGVFSLCSLCSLISSSMDATFISSPHGTGKSRRCSIF
jgi:hypothetical protein